MNDRFTSRRLDRVVLGVVVGLAILIAGLTVYSQWFGVSHPELVTLSGEALVGGRGPLGIKFSQIMNRQSVEDRIVLIPESTGRWEWEEDRIAWFYPDRAFQSGSVMVVQIKSGVMSQDGRRMRNDFEQAIQVRSNKIAFIGQPLVMPEIWLVDQDGTAPKQLTNTDGSVYDFAVSPDGEWIVYSRLNFRGGSDLYVIDRFGKGEKLLVECGEYNCQEPVWARNGIDIAYRQSGRDFEENGQPPNSILYSVNVESGQNNPIFTNPNVRGMEPSFSPDGKIIGFYDLVVGAVRLVNLLDGSNEVIPSAIPAVGAWSPDSKKLIVADLVPGTYAPYVQLLVVELENRTLTHLFENGPEGIDYSIPAWSPDGKWLLVGRRYVDGLVNKQIWLMRPDGSQARAVSQDPTTTHAAYSWSPDGRHAVYQRFRLGGSEDRPEIILWDFEKDEQRILADNGALPEWMP